MVEFRNGELLTRVLYCPSICGTLYWDILKKAQKNQLFGLADSQPLSPQGPVIVTSKKPILPVSLQRHLLILTLSSPINQHHPVQLHKEIQRAEGSRLQV